MKAPSQIKEIFEQGDSFLLTSHESPDSDALGSMLALADLLESLGKSVFLYNPSRIPYFLEFLPGIEKINNTLPDPLHRSFDALVVLDCPVASRAGRDFEQYAMSTGCPIVIIDHHREVQSSAAVKWVETEAPATAILVYEIFKVFSSSFTPQSATCIFAAVSGDTGSFRFSNANARSFAVASEMVRHGAKPQEISSAIYENQPPERINLLARVLQTLETDKTGSIAWVRIDKEMFESTRTSREDSEGMVDFPMSIRGVKVAVLFRRESGEKGGFWKASIRSRGDIDVCELANRFGGGGHKNASGFTFENDIEEVIEKITGEINRA